MELTTALHRVIRVSPSSLAINRTTGHGEGIAAVLTPREARKIADALDPERDVRVLTTPNVLVRDDYTLDEARALVARLEADAARVAAVARLEGIEALAALMAPTDNLGGDAYNGIAARAYDRGVRAPSAPTTEEN